MNVSFVIPTLNEEKYIGELLKSILQQTVRPYETIVVDCGSHDNTQSIVRSYKGVTLLTSDKPVGNQRTYGGKKARGDMPVSYTHLDVYKRQILCLVFLRTSSNFLEKISVTM